MKKLQSYVVCFLLTWFPFSSGAQNSLNTYEYWFNNNYNDKQSSIINTNEHHFSEVVDVSALPDGVNVLNIRYRDENRLYSSTLSKVFYKTMEAEQVNKSLVAYEIWFNDDFENRQVNAFTAKTGHQVFTEINVSTLPEGVNVLNIRYKDEKGLYSSTLSRIFYKTEESVLTETNITGYKYWFDNDYENAVYVQLQAPVRQFSIEENLDITHITKGAHSLHFQFLDSNGKWSVVTTDNITKSAVPLAAFTVSNSNSCSGATVHFTNESIDSDTWQWEFGDGETSAEFEPEHIFSEAGDFEVKLTAIDSETGRESSTMQVVTIFPSYNSTLPQQNVEICTSETPYTFGTQQLHESGTYTETFSTIDGCDSTITLNLTVHPGYDVMYSGDDAAPAYLVNDTFEETAANTFPDGWTIRYEGTGFNDHYVTNVLAKNGLHSLKVSGSGWAANLSKKVDDIPDNVTLEGWIRAENVTTGGRCGLGIGNPDAGDWGAFWARVEFYNGNLITFYYTGNSGGYGTQYILQPASPDTWYHIKIEADAAAGTYKVFINGVQVGSDTGGNTISEFPLYTSVPAISAEIYGNSLVYFDDIRMYESGNSSVIICESDLPYTFGDNELTETGDYTQTFESIHGCDSTVTLRLTVNPIYHHIEEAVICDGESFSFNGLDYTESGEYQHTLQSVNGCDSVTTLQLTVNPAYNHTEEAAICHGDTYAFGTQNLTTAGEYTERFESVSGCDSTVVLTLNVNPVSNHTDEATICQSETYMFGAQNLTTAGVYTEVFESVTGCDSTVVLTLNVIPLYNHTEEATICRGETYAFGTQNLTRTGEYTEVFESVTGCDSAVVLTLNVIPVYNHTDEATICQGETFTFGTQNLTTAGEYTEVFESATGCDSTVVLTLNVNPVYSHTDEAVICQGETFAFGTQNLIATGEYTEVFESFTGCDSTVVLTLNVNPVYNHTDEAVIFDGETYVFGTQNLVTAGEYTEVFESVTGCDSTVVLTLSIPVGTELFHTSGIKTYPNPTTGKLYIDFPRQAKQITGVKVFNSLGMEVFHKVISDEEHLEIDLGSCASGMYVLKASGAEHCITRKIILKTEY